MGDNCGMSPVAIALGSNVGDSLTNLQEAVKLLAEIVSGMQASGVYTSVPMYVSDQPPFLNAAVIGQTDLGPLALLARLKAIEQEIGRTKTLRFGPREIDLDLVSYGSLSYRGPNLQLPHERIPERRFVLLPLFEIDPELRLATMGKVADLLAQTESQAEDVVLEKDAVLSVPSNR